MQALQSLYYSPTRALASPRGILLTSQPPSRSSLLPHFPCSNSLEISLRPPVPPSPTSCQGGRCYWINIIIITTIFAIIIFIIATLKVAAIWRGTDQSRTEFASQQSAPGEIFNEGKTKVCKRTCFSFFMALPHRFGGRCPHQLVPPSLHLALERECPFPQVSSDYFSSSSIISFPPSAGRRQLEVQKQGIILRQTCSLLVCKTQYCSPDVRDV